jgi:hypothetical protein
MIEAMKQALEFFESGNFVYPTKIATDLRQAIAELESQEPVATVTSETGADITMSWWHEPALPVGTKLFTHPPQRTEPVDYEKLAALGWQAIECGICGGGAMGYPQRTWVGLTDYEIGVCSTEAAMNRSEMVGGAVTFARAIEAKLKEKNNA